MYFTSCSKSFDCKHSSTNMCVNCIHNNLRKDNFKSKHEKNSLNEVFEKYSKNESK